MGADGAAPSSTSGGDAGPRERWVGPHPRCLSEVLDATLEDSRVDGVVGRWWGLLAHTWCWFPEIKMARSRRSGNEGSKEK